MLIHITSDEAKRWEVESRAPQGELVDITVSDIHICEGAGCYSGFADVHPHLMRRWENGAARREPIELTWSQQRDWLLEHRRDLYLNWLSGKGWAHGEL